MAGALRVPIDAAGGFLLAVEKRPGAVVLRLEREGAARQPLLQRALEACLRVRSRGRDLSLSPVSGSVEVPREGPGLAVLLAAGEAEPVSLFALRLGDEPSLDGPAYALSPFETRFLADNGFPHPVPKGAGTEPIRLTTDLHTHFAGCVRPRDLLRVGLEAGVAYPRALLLEAGVRAEGRETVPLAELSPELLGVLERRLAVPPDRQVAFVEMERIYRLRSPITKSLRAFGPLCRQIARDYRSMGVTYVELSLSNVVESAWLSAIHREVPAIERETGTRLRFLAALSRHDDLEWDLDLLERMRGIAGSRYFAGVDFMGHETNSTHAFARQLREVALFADAERPGLAVRVHAGENPAHPENVRVAAECVEGTRVALRIGHGLYGGDARTLEALARVNATVEFNLGSNLALNNIQTTRQVPLAHYLEAGIPAVLGSDGYGIYESALPLELQAARLAGLSERGARLLAEAEERYLLERERHERSSTLEPHVFAVPDDPPARHFTPEVARRKTEDAERLTRELTGRLAGLGLSPVTPEAVPELARGRDVLAFAGAWKKSWLLLSPAMAAKVRHELASLLDALDPGRTLLVTGGTHHGLEGLVHELARPRGFPVLGALVTMTPPESLDRSLTHAVVLGRKLHDKAAGLYRLLKDLDGLTLFVGGGSIVSDEVQTAANLGARYLLMDGPEGASSEHARLQPRLAVRTAAEVLERWGRGERYASVTDPYWHLGANPIVDVVVVRARPSGADELLLIRRADDAAAEPGLWALPGGFQLTGAPRGAPWTPGLETARDAAVRELREETGLDLGELAPLLLPVGVYEGRGRDPRDTAEAWSVSHAFAVRLPAYVAFQPVAGGDDAGDARWCGLDRLPERLAFDHARILDDALAALGMRPASPRDPLNASSG